MRLVINTRQRRLANRYLVAIGLSSTLPSFLVAAPVDQLLPANSALIEPAEKLSRVDRVEVSLLQSPEKSEALSIGDLPSILTAVKSTESVTSKASELLQQRFENGKVSIERYVTEDAEGDLVNHGPYKEYDASGTLIRSGSYAFGKLDGKWVQTISPERAQALSTKMDPGFRPPFRSEATFIDGQLQGDWTVSDSKGNPVFVWQFEMGKRENVSTWFDSRRTPVLETMYADGAPNGPSTQAVPGQREPKRIVYDKGRIVQPKTNWHERGKKRSEETLLAPAANRLVAHDWWASNVVSEPLHGGIAVREGLYTAWHPNGQKSIEGNFSSGTPNGEFERWYTNGQLESKGYFQEGVPLGEWVYYHPNGMKLMQGSYENGVQVGQWSNWNAEGRLKLRALAADFPVVEQTVEVEQIVDLVPSRIHAKPASNNTRRPTIRTASVRTISVLKK